MLTHDKVGHGLGGLRMDGRQDRIDSLRDSERLFRCVFESSAVAMVTTDLKGCFTRVNEAACRMLGHSPTDFLAKTIDDITLPDDRDATAESCRSLVRGDVEHFTLEKRYRHRDGHTVWGEVTASLLRDAVGKPECLVAQLHDITAKRQAQETLARGRERDRSLFDHSPVPLWEEDFSEVKRHIDDLRRRGVTDFHDHFALPENAAAGAALVRITDVNRAALQLHEAESKEQLLAALSSILTEKSHAAIAAQLIAIAEGRTEYECEASAKTLRGREVDTALRWVVVPGHEDTMDRVHLSTIDITERKRADLAFHSLFDQSPIAIQLFDADGTLTDANRRTLDLFGVDDKQDLLGLAMWDYPGHSPEEMERVKAGQSVYLAVEFDFRIARERRLFSTTKTGILHLDVFVFPLTVAGTITGYTVQLLDMTERKQVEDQLRQAQKLESIGRLAGGIAHDFNNILMPITGYVELAMHEMKNDDPSRDGLVRAQEAAGRAASLTRQILAFSRKQVLRTRIMDLNDVLADFEDMLRRLIGEDIRLTVLPAEGLHPVEVDPGQIEQVLMNLAVNSRDAMPGGGSLSIETANVVLDEGSVEAAEGSGTEHYVEMTIRDTGHGMDAGTREQMFEPFFTTKGPGKGSGLGLSTTFGIVKQHGGIIRIASEPEEGTAVSVYLPRADGAGPRAEPATTESEPLSGTGTILVVEDEDSVRRFVAQTLTSLGYDVIKARHPDEALQLAARHKDTIDLLLTDVVMPGMSGTELCRQLDALVPDLRVVYMSGYTDDTIVHHGVLNEGVLLLQKPFGVHRLGRMVRQALSPPRG